MSVLHHFLLGLLSLFSSVDIKMFLLSGTERNLVRHVSETTYGLHACALIGDFFDIVEEVGEETLSSMRHGEGVSTYCGSFLSVLFLFFF